MLPGKPLALYHAADGVLQADALGRISGLTDWSGNLNATPATTAARQGYVMTTGPNAPYLYFPRLTNAGGTFTVTSDSYASLPTSWTKNTTGTPGTVSVAANNLAMFAVCMDIDEALHANVTRAILSNTNFVGAWWLNWTGNAGSLYCDGASNFEIARASYRPSCGWKAVGVVAKSNGVTFYDGSRASGVTASGTPASTALSGAQFLGSKTASGTLAIKLFALYDRSNFSNAELDAIFDAMNGLYRLAPTTVAILCHGDSLTLGAGMTLGRSYPTQMPLPPGWVVRTNAGVSGYTWGTTAANMTVAAPTTIDPLFMPGIDNVLLAWAGINDSDPGGANISIAQIQTNRIAYKSARRTAAASASVKSLVIGTATTPPGFASENTLNAVNNDLRANFKADGFDFLFDVTQWPPQSPIARYGGNIDTVNYYTDILHPSNRGNEILGAGWTDCLIRYRANPTRSDVPWLLV